MLNVLEVCAIRPAGTVISAANKNFFIFEYFILIKKLFSFPTDQDHRSYQQDQSRQYPQ
jgi:hypothetical protein